MPKRERATFYGATCTAKGYLCRDGEELWQQTLHNRKQHIRQPTLVLQLQKRKCNFNCKECCQSVVLVVQVLKVCVTIRDVCDTMHCFICFFGSVKGHNRRRNDVLVYTGLDIRRNYWQSSLLGRGAKSK